MSRPWVLRAIQAVPPQFPGKARLARALLQNWIAGEGSADVPTRYGTFRVPSMREPVAQGLLFDGAYEPQTVALMAKALPPEGCYVDVGANVGALAVPLALRVGPKGCVLAIEADPAIYALLAENLRRLAGSQAEALHAAVSAETGVRRFFPAPAEKFGMGSLSDTFGGSGVEVDTIRLDDLLPDRVPDVLKVDVEGHEAGVFQGAERILSASPGPLVVFEFIDWAERNAGLAPGAAQLVLLDHGYRLWTEDAWSRGGGSMTSPMTEGGGMLVASRRLPSP